MENRQVKVIEVKNDMVGRDVFASNLSNYKRGQPITELYAVRLDLLK